MARVINRLKARQVETLKTVGLHADGGNLYLRVDPGGAKRWAFVFRWRGKRTEMGLGPVHTISLSEARDKARDARKVLSDGGNPLDEKRRQRAEQSAKTFGELADELRAEAEKTWKGKAHRRQAKLILETYCAPLRSLTVHSVSTDDVIGVLKPIWAEKPETASRVRARIEWVLDAARAMNLRTGDNPARWSGHLALLLPERKGLSRGHHAAMPYEQIPEFLVKLRGSEGISARALEFTILTAARTGETLGAMAEEFDREEAVWTLSAERMKASREHRVPLPERALKIVVDLWPSSGTDIIFRSRGRRGAPLSNMAMANTLSDLGTGTVHGFRSAFKDWATDETDTPREVIEAALAHRVGDATEQAYRRRDALAKRRKLMEAWAKFCGG